MDDREEQIFIVLEEAQRLVLKSRPDDSRTTLLERSSQAHRNTHDN